jgi:hypothetical protein
MDFVKSVLRSMGIPACEVRQGLIAKDTIVFLYKKMANDNNISAIVTAKDGSATGYIRHCRDNLFEVMLCRECLVTDFVSAARVIANAQKCRQGIA